MDNFTIEHVDLKRNEHRTALISLLNDYMMDEKGCEKTLATELHSTILNDLSKHPSYKGYLLTDGINHIALANCFVNYSTFQASYLLNIHDFIVSPKNRRKGAGKSLLQHIVLEAQKNQYCRVNLEVREDNLKALAMYSAQGFDFCRPNMLFIEKKL